MNKKLTPKHLEVLLKIALSDEPVKITTLIDDRFASDLKDIGLIDQDLSNGTMYSVPCCYELSEKGRDYYNKILQDASEHFENNTNSN